MIKRLLLPGLAVGAVAFAPAPSGAATFTIDSFNHPVSPEQRLQVGRTNQTPLPVTVTGLANVLGGSRQLRLELLPPLPSSNFLTGVAKVTGSEGLFDINNQLSVTSRTTLRYDSNGAGLGTAGQWLTGQYRADYYTIKILDLIANPNTSMNITFRIGDIFGQNAQITRIATKQSDGSISLNNPTNLLPPSLQPQSTAIYEITEFLTSNPNINLNNVRYAEFVITGPSGFDAKLDFIQGVEIPEPSLVIGSLVVVGLGGLLSKNKK